MTGLFQTRYGNTVVSVPEILWPVCFTGSLPCFYRFFAAIRHQMANNHPGTGFVIFVEVIIREMPHHHDHTHPYALTPGSDSGMGIDRALMAGILLNLIFVVVEAAAGFWQNSLALLSDAGHNLFDVASLALALLAFRLAKMKPNDDYTYGYRKTTILVALLNAVILLIAIGGIGFEAVRRLLQPEAVQGGVLAIVAAVGILINGFTAFLFIRDKDTDLNLKGAYLHMAADALVSLGVVIAGLVIIWTHWYWLDPVISFMIMAVILISTWGLLKDSLRLSLDGVPREVDMQAVRHAAMETKGILDIHHVHVWAMSTTQNALTAHLVVAPGTGLAETEGIKENLRGKLEKLRIDHSTFELETQDEACKEKSCPPEEGIQATRFHS
jgi:cobalt-zinc-cadmium efflux system protein